MIEKEREGEGEEKVTYIDVRLCIAHARYDQTSLIYDSRILRGYFDLMHK